MYMEGKYRERRGAVMVVLVGEGSDSMDVSLQSYNLFIYFCKMCL